MTTRQEILEGEGFEYGYVLAIHGYDKLITNRADVSAMLEAWSDTPWKEAISGLIVEGQPVQSIQPWDFGLDVSTMTFRVMDEDDELGRAIWKRPGHKTELISELTSDDETSFTVQDRGPLGSNGVAHVGGERIEVSSGASLNSLLIEKRGTLAPLRAGGTDYVMPRAHKMPDVERRVGERPAVTDEPGAFIGRDVGLWIHKIEGGKWADKDHAVPYFAGTIGEVGDDGEAVVLRCDDLRKRIDETVLFENQYRAKIAEGVRLTDGMKFTLRESTFGPGFSESVDWSVGEDIEPGRYTISELIVELNSLISAAVSAGDLEGDHALNLRNTDEGLRVQWSVEYSGDNEDAAAMLFLGCTHESVLEFMGMSAPRVGSDFGIDNYYVWSWSSGDRSRRFILPHPPMRNLAFRSMASGERDRYVIELENEEGEWLDLTDWLPHPLDREMPFGNAGIAQVGSRLVVARKIGPTLQLYVPKTEGPLAQSGSGPQDFEQSIEDEGDVEVKQVLMIEGAPSDLIPKLLASIDGNDVNSVFHDKFPWGAAIPWEVLSTPSPTDDIRHDLRAIEADTAQGSMNITLEEPTELGDILFPEMALRYMFLVWKDGRYRFISPPEPNAFEADWVLDESNKGRPAEDRGRDPTEAQWTDEHLTNIIKIKHNRDLVSGEYTEEIDIINEASKAEYGARQREIKARNSYHNFTRSADDVEELAAGLAARMAPVYGRPLWVASRSINGKLALAAPGDIVSMTDQVVRNRVTGERGAVSRAGVIIRHSFDWGENNGEIRILFGDEERVFPVAPSADLVAYDDENDVITVSEDEYTFQILGSAEDIDDFNVADVVDVIEKNALDPLKWQGREIVSKNAATRELGLDAPLNGFDAGKSYRVVPTHFDGASPAHRLRAYQANKENGLIDEQALPNEWVHYELAGWPDAESRPAEVLSPDYYGDGAPLSSALLMTAARSANNLVNHLTAFNMPLLTNRTLDFEGHAGWRFVDAWEIFVGSGKLPAGTTRRMRVSPRFRVSIVDPSDTARVRVYSSGHPVRGAWTTDHPAEDQLYGAYRHVEFSTGSTDWQSPEPQEIPVVYREGTGTTFLVIFVSGTLEFGGLEICQLGAIES